MKTENNRMSWESYAYLCSLLKQQMSKLENDYHTALNFIPTEKYSSKKQSGLDKAHAIFIKEHLRLKDVADELRRAAAATYRDHPSKEMREFWGIKE